MDAAFLRRAQRDRFRDLANRLGAVFLIVSCAAPDAVLRDRVARRAVQARDASEAGVQVLERQFATHQPLAGDEAAAAVRVSTASQDGMRRGVETVLSRLAGRQVALEAH